MDIAAWLRSLGLERYEQAFRDNDIDADVLPGLTAEDLKDLGITSVGHRRKILDAIAALARPAPAPAAAPDVAPRPRGLTAVAAEAERRQLTVMFCDLVGSSTLAAELDPEDMGEIIRVYQRCVTEVVERFDGYVAKYMGDGVLAYFGYPQAHEDVAERAVRAGLGIVEAVGALQPREGLRLRVRVGIATGPVVVGELIGQGTAQEQVVVGDAPNVAARLQELAEPDAVVIGPNTLRLTGGVFECADLGRYELRGLAEPVQAWRVLGPSRVEGRFEARQRMDLTPLVAREHEIALLLDRWQLAKDGEGQVVLLCGEPGIGKSRVTRALRERLGREAYTPLRYHCSPYHRDSPLHPIVDQLERAAGFHREDSAAVKLDKLEALLHQADGHIAATAPLIADLLAIPTGGRYPPLDLTPQRRREKLFEALLAQLEGLAAKRPVLDVFEDVHWIDPTSLELLGHAVDRVLRLPVLLLITFRPEFTPPWTGRAHVTTLSLGHLGRHQVTAMIERVTGSKALPPEVADQIVAKTDGVPLFVEELTKAVLESGLLRDAGDRYELAGPLPPLAVPTTLHDSLMARLDRLAPVKEVAQIGAVIGREFSHELIAAVAPLPEAATRQALDQLVAAELVFRRGMPPEATYSFKHALVQDAAYQSLLRSRRQQLHARIAQVLEERFPETAEVEPELLARHFTEAGLAGRAVEYWHKAGQHAAVRSANVEAIGHLTRSLEALEALPDAPERTQRELEILMDLGPVLMAAKGEAAPEVEETYTRARALCERLGDTPRLFRVLRGLWIFYLEAAKLRSARELGEQLLALAEGAGDDGFLLEADRALGITLFWQGELASARAHLEQGAALYDLERHRAHALIYGLDPAVHCLAYGARSLWFLGYPDQALQRIEEALARAREAAHPFSLAAAHYFAGRLHLYRREGRLAQAQAEAAMALSTEQRFPEWLAVATALRGAALLAQGDLEAGIAQMEEGLRAGEATGGRLGLPLFLALLAEGYARAGSADEGLRLATEALALGRDTGERVYEAELHRIEGEMRLLRSRDGQEEAETRFRRAVELARSQGASSLELRTATSLARLWRDRDKRAEAFDLLAPICGRFTEGLDTADLKDARALLDGLGESGARSPQRYLGSAPA